MQELTSNDRKRKPTQSINTEMQFFQSGPKNSPSKSGAVQSEPSAAIDFSELTNTSESIQLKSVVIKEPSKLIAPDRVTCKKHAFHAGSRIGTGSSSFYKLIPKFKEVLGILPPSKTGKLVDIFDVTLNEARNLNALIIKLVAQFNRVMDDLEMGSELKKEAALLALYFLEDCYNRLPPILANLKIYNGLLKGNAVIGYGGFIVAGKEPLNEPHPYLLKKEREKKIELSLLDEVCNDHSPLESAKLRLTEIGLTEKEFVTWKSINKGRIEVTLNTTKGAGEITGVSIQGTVTSAINFGIAAALLNPIIFAAGAYYFISAMVNVGEIAVRIHLENNLIREELRESEKPAEHILKTKKRTLSKIETVEDVGKIRNVANKLSNSAFGTASVFSNPLSTGKPETQTQPKVITTYLI